MAAAAAAAVAATGCRAQGCGIALLAGLRRVFFFHFVLIQEFACQFPCFLPGSGSGGGGDGGGGGGGGMFGLSANDDALAAITKLYNHINLATISSGTAILAAASARAHRQEHAIFLPRPRRLPDFFSPRHATPRACAAEGSFETIEDRETASLSL